MLGGIIAAALVDGLTPGSVSVGVALAPGVSKGQGLVWEAAGTCVLILSILFLAAGMSDIMVYLKMAAHEVRETCHDALRSSWFRLHAVRD